MKENKIVEISTQGRVQTIVMNRPEKRNALSPNMVDALQNAFTRAEQDPGTRIIILRANGPAFSAGADLEYLMELQNQSYDANYNDSRKLATLFFSIYQSRKIVISMVEGPAIAGGCGLASACDFIFSVPSATFGYTEVKIGFVPAIVTFFLIRKVGESRAKELLLTGELIQAETAKALGLVNRIIDESTINEEVAKFAEKLCTDTSSVSIAMTKELIGSLPGKSAEDILKGSSETNAKSRMTEDFKRGLGAFLNKEKTNW